MQLFNLFVVDISVVVGAAAAAAALAFVTNYCCEIFNRRLTNKKYDDFISFVLHPIKSLNPPVNNCIQLYSN